jgi:hemerythrin
MSNEQPYIVWTEELKTHFPTIDNQHKKIIDIANDLHSSLGSVKLQEVIKTHLSQWERYSTIHFRFEEKILHDQNYSFLNEHECLHDAYVGEFLRLEERFAELENSLPQISTFEELESFAWKILRFVSRWWLHHIWKKIKNMWSFFKVLRVQLRVTVKKIRFAHKWPESDQSKVGVVFSV